MTDAPTPGWYHAEGDPPNTQRYWDGNSWQGDPQPITHTPASAAPSTAAVYYGGAASQPMTRVSYAENSQSTTALVWAIVGLTCCGVGGPIGWYFAQKELNAIDAGLRDPSNRGMAKAAKIIGIIVTVLMILGMIFYTVVIIAAANTDPDMLE